MSSHKQADDGDQGRSQPTTPRVAVDVLQRDQQAILFDGDPNRNPQITALTGGFDSRRAAINWWQAAVVRTFGHLADDFPAIQLTRDGTLATALYLDPDAGGAEHERERVREWVMDACQTAYRDLEVKANEWLAESDGDADWTTIDPAEQRHVAMRPAFSRLDTEQARTLTDLWGGFEDRESLMRWAHSLPAVADFSDTLDTGVPNALARDSHALAMMQSDSKAGRFWRERWAVTFLLPAFATRAKRLQASEQAARTRDDNPWNKVE